MATDFLGPSSDSGLRFPVSAFHWLLQEPDREGIPVALAIADLHGGDDHADNPRHDDRPKQDESDGKQGQSDKNHAKHGGYPAESRRDDAIDRVRDLEVQDLLPLSVYLGAVCALDQPDGKRCEDMHEGPAEQNAGESGEMQTDAPGSGVLGGCGRHHLDGGT